MIGVEELVKKANLEVETWSVERVEKAQADHEIVVVDIRDIRELAREGRVPGAVHAPRGMLEFWVDPTSPYHREVFAQNDKTYVFFCAAAWRSALAAKSMQDMGFGPVAHMEGGFANWRELGKPVELADPKNIRPDKSSSKTD